MVPSISPGNKTFSERAKFGPGQEPADPSMLWNDIQSIDWLADIPAFMDSIQRRFQPHT